MYISLALGEDQIIIAAVQYESEFFDEKNKVLFESSDGGKTWKVINETVKGLTRYGQPISFFHSLYLLEQQPTNPNELFGDSGVISHSTDGGKNWEVVFDKGEFSSFFKNK